MKKTTEPVDTENTQYPFSFFFFFKMPLFYWLVQQKKQQCKNASLPGHFTLQRETQDLQTELTVKAFLTVVCCNASNAFFHAWLHLNLLLVSISWQYIQHLGIYVRCQCRKWCVFYVLRWRV